MASRKQIKGITIEVNGDVTKLDKALGSVDKSIKVTQSNLKDVERLLKLDPKNVELLDQKQRLLSQQVEQTADKYEMLKKTMEESTASNVRYEKWEQAQASLQGQITKTENTLQELEKEQKRLQELNFAPDSSQMVEIQEKIDATREKAANLQQQMTDTYEELGRPISIDQYDALQREMVEAEAAMKDAKKAAQDFDPALAALGAQMDNISDKAKGVADATKGISAGAAAGVAALAGMAVSAGAWADDMNTAAKQSGFTQEFLQSVEYASDRVDVEFDSIISAGTKLKKNMGNMSADVQAAFQQLGVGIHDSTGGLRDVEGTFMDLIMALSQVPNETERDVLAMTLFGKSADDLAGLIDDGAKAFLSYRQEAQDLGLILSQDALDGANAFNDGLDTIKARGKAAFIEAGASLAENLLPELDSLVTVLTNVLQWFSNLDGGTLKFIMTIMMLVAAISPVASGISGIASAISGLIGILPTLQGGISAIWGLMTANPIGAVITLVGLLVTAFVTLYNKCEWFRDMVDSVFSSITEKIQGFIDWVKKGVDAVKNFFGFGSKGSPDPGGTSSYSYDPPGFASGGVFEPNSPILGVLGDNKQEREVAAPESMLRGLMREELSRVGGGQSTTKVTVQFTGSLAQLGRVLQPVVSTETQRQGTSLVPQT